MIKIGSDPHGCWKA